MEAFWYERLGLAALDSRLKDLYRPKDRNSDLQYVHSAVCFTPSKSKATCTDLEADFLPFRTPQRVSTVSSQDSGSANRPKRKLIFTPSKAKIPLPKPRLLPFKSSESSPDASWEQVSDFDPDQLFPPPLSYQSEAIFPR